MTVQTKETQNQTQIESYLRDGGICLGPWTSYIWRDDPRHLGFLLARYKFCAKMLTGRNSALEVGCGDAFGLLVVLQTVNTVHGIDFEPLVIDDAQKRHDDALLQRATLSVHDMTDGPVVGSFDAAYSLDVVEHIPTDIELRFMHHLCQSLTQHSVCIIGTPNIEGHRFASPLTAKGHINLKSAESLRTLMSKHFYHVLLRRLSQKNRCNDSSHLFLSVWRGHKIMASVFEPKALYVLDSFYSVGKIGKSQLDIN